MEWSTFITWICGLYVLWYAGNILKDLLFSKRSAKVGQSTLYDIGDFTNDEESIEVNDSDFYVASETKGSVQEAINTSEPAVDLKPTAIAFEEPPTGQGIPLSEFLKSFKAKAEISAQKIQFN